MWSAYSHYREGALPEAGGMLDQSATFYDAVSLMGQMIACHEGIDREKAKHGA